MITSIDKILWEKLKIFPQIYSKFSNISSWKIFYKNKQLIKTYLLEWKQMSTIFEFIALGNYVKVIAVDEKTGIEISTLFPKNLTKKLMQESALKKLEWKLKNLWIC